MSPRVLLVIAAVAIAGGIAWMQLRKGSEQGASDVAKAPDPAAPTPVAVTPPIAPVAIPQAAPPKPALPEQNLPKLPEGVAPTLADLYKHEPRDLEWGPRTEKEIEHRLAHLKGGNLQETECHVSQCQVTLASNDPKGLQVAIGELESKKGLVGFATGMYLTAPEKRPDGSLVLRAYASFDR